MCSDLKLLDTVGLQNKLMTNNAINCSHSQDNRYSITVEDGFYVLQLCGFMNNVLSTISFKKIFTEVPQYIISSHLEVDINSFINQLPQFDLYETVLRLDLSENLNNSVPTKQTIIKTVWSPSGLIINGHCALSTLTNTGALHILVPTFNEVELEEYVCIANVSQHCINHFRKSWIKLDKTNCSAKLQELKRRAEEVTPTACTWSHLIDNNGNQKYCLFVVGHLNGGLTVWKFYARNANDVREAKLELMGYYKTELKKKITALQWQQAGKNGLLIIGDLEGKVEAVSITNINDESVTFGNEMYLWNESDNIIVEHFDILIYNKMIYILIIKGSFLLICLINKSGKLLDVFSFQVGNFQITGLQHFEENIYLVLTYTGVLKELKLSCEDNKIKVDWRPLYIDFKWSSVRTHGLIVSPNKVFIMILVNISQLKCRKYSKDPVRLLVFMNMGKDPLAVLMKNNTDALTTYWDCLETLRLDGLLEKKLPCDGLPAGLDYDKLSLIQLKTCLWLAQSSEMMYNKMYTIEEYNILRYEEFKYIVQIKLAIDHMQHLLELIAEGTRLSEFHMQSLDIINMFLKEKICSDTIPNLGLGKNTIDELYEVISAANELEYPPPPTCMWCKEKIVGLSCVPTHIDTRCTISFMPITGLPYYKCPYCECIVHNKLNEVYNTVLCSNCDVPMNFISFLINSDDCDTKRNIKEDSDDIDTVSCSDDCSNENINLTDIEDHAFTSIEEKGDIVNLIWVSSSEDEDDSHTKMEEDKKSDT